MKKINARTILWVVIATGISSLVTQLLTIREFLTQFQGNEIVIALILFNWLILGGIGTLAANKLTKRNHQPTDHKLAYFSLALCILAVLQILAIRLLRDFIFISGSSVGFYPTLAFGFCTIAPYCLLLGFVLPYSLFVLRSQWSDYPGARIYIFDNIGDISGGALFSFILVFLVSPLTALFLAHLPLLVCSTFLFSPSARFRSKLIIALILVAAILGGAIGIEKWSLAPSEGRLAFYDESRYGRIAVHQDREQFTLFANGIPMFSTHNLSLAEETIHYPMSQLDDGQHVLLISSQGGIMKELAKYKLKSIDYVELDPAMAAVQFQFNLNIKIKGLQIIHEDGRAYLSQSQKIYDAIIVNLPEPDTFQLNRFYTDTFFKQAASHLSKNGILSFCMQGFDNYLAEPQRQKLSSLYNTAATYFEQVLLLPGQKVFFLCSNAELKSNIPELLKQRGIETTYISGFFHGNLSSHRIAYLNQGLDASTPRNIDTAPYLMRLMFKQWFAKFQTSPLGFFIAFAILCGLYLIRISRESFVLFATGGMTLGAEILVIFAFQIYFGYIYLQIGIIITLFLAGLLPGAWLGNRLHRQQRRILILSDLFLMAGMVLFILVMTQIADQVPAGFFLAFGFIISLACGFQFPVALSMAGSDDQAATQAFSADLLGAATGVLLTSMILIPHVGIIWTAVGLIGLKAISLVVMAIHKP